MPDVRTMNLDDIAVRLDWMLAAPDATLVAAAPDARG